MPSWVRGRRSSMWSCMCRLHVDVVDVVVDERVWRKHAVVGVRAQHECTGQHHCSVRASKSLKSCGGLLT
eukprot:13998695-Heterocapsa_arctica.AAC.1